MGNSALAPPSFKKDPQPAPQHTSSLASRRSVSSSLVSSRVESANKTRSERIVDDIINGDVHDFDPSKYSAKELAMIMKAVSSKNSESKDEIEKEIKTLEGKIRSLKKHCASNKHNMTKDMMSKAVREMKSLKAALDSALKHRHVSSNIDCVVASSNNNTESQSTKRNVQKFAQLAQVIMNDPDYKQQQHVSEANVNVLLEQTTDMVNEQQSYSNYADNFTTDQNVNDEFDELFLDEDVDDNTVSTHEVSGVNVNDEENPAASLFT